MRFESVALGGDRSSFVQGEARLGGGEGEERGTRQVLEIGNLAKLLVRIVVPFLLWEAMILPILESILSPVMIKFYSSFFQI